MADILAIIPFYKRQDQLDKCLAALAASTVPIEPWVHDNTQHNLGFTKACNLGLREAMRRGHKYAMLLNQDCYVQPDSVEKAVAFMDAHPACAICGPKQLRAEEPDLIIHGGCSQAYPAGVHFGGRVSQGNCAVSLPMPWVNGACMVFRVDSLYFTGLMDEKFFLIASDSDICFTARQRGYEVWYCAESVVLHEGGVSSKGPPDIEYAAHFNADQLHFRDKWLGSMGWELLKEVPPHRQLTNEEIVRVLQQAANFINQNQLPQAELVLRNLLTYTPEHPDALLLLGTAYLRQNLPGVAARELKKVVERVPESGNAMAAYADAVLSCGRADLALDLYRKAMSLGLDNPGLRTNYGLALVHSGDQPAGFAEWRRILGQSGLPQSLAQSVHALLKQFNAPDVPPVPGGAAAGGGTGATGIGGGGGAGFAAGPSGGTFRMG